MSSSASSTTKKSLITLNEYELKHFDSITHFITNVGTVVNQYYQDHNANFAHLAKALGVDLSQFTPSSSSTQSNKSTYCNTTVSAASAKVASLPSLPSSNSFDSIYDVNLAAEAIHKERLGKTVMLLNTCVLKTLMPNTSWSETLDALKSVLKEFLQQMAKVTSQETNVLKKALNKMPNNSHRRGGGSGNSAQKLQSYQLNQLLIETNATLWTDRIIQVLVEKLMNLVNHPPPPPPITTKDVSLLPMDISSFFNTRSDIIRPKTCQLQPVSLSF